MLFLMGLAMSIGLTSCVTTAQASDDLYDEDTNVNVVINMRSHSIIMMPWWIWTMKMSWYWSIPTTESI